MPYNHTWMISGVHLMKFFLELYCLPVHLRSVLFQNFESSEEGTRNVVAECVGKLTLLEPQTLLPRLQVTSTRASQKLFSLVISSKGKPQFTICLCSWYRGNSIQIYHLRSTSANRSLTAKLYH